MGAYHLVGEPDIQTDVMTEKEIKAVTKVQTVLPARMG